MWTISFNDINKSNDQGKCSLHLILYFSQNTIPQAKTLQRLNQKLNVIEIIFFFSYCKLRKMMQKEKSINFSQIRTQNKNSTKKLNRYEFCGRNFEWIRLVDVFFFVEFRLRSSSQTAIPNLCTRNMHTQL